MANSFSGGGWCYGGFPLGKTELYSYNLCTSFVCIMLHLQSLPKRGKEKKQQLLMSKEERRAEGDVLIRGVVSKNS